MLVMEAFHITKLPATDTHLPPKLLAMTRARAIVKTLMLVSSPTAALQTLRIYVKTAYCASLGLYREERQFSE